MTDPQRERAETKARDWLWKREFRDATSGDSESLANLLLEFARELAQPEFETYRQAAYQWQEKWRTATADALEQAARIIELHGDATVYGEFSIENLAGKIRAQLQQPAKKGTQP